MSAGVICERLRTLVDSRERTATFVWTLLEKCYSFPAVAGVGVIVTPVLAWLVGPGCWSWLAAGYVDIHWSRIVLAGLIAFGLFQQGVTTLTVNLFRFHSARRIWPARASVARPITLESSGMRPDAPTPAAPSIAHEPLEVR